MKHPFCLLSLLLVIIITGCAPTTVTMAPSSTVTHFPSLTAISSTSTPLRPTATFTLTPPVPLNPEQARATIQVLLQKPVDCSAPCFWGIVPGQTTPSEAENIFTRFGLKMASTTYEGKYFSGVNYDYLSLIVTLTIQENIVKSLRVKILPEKQKSDIPREWLAYSPETLINRYGWPSRVDFAIDWGPRSYFEMNMYFDAFDLIVEYSGYDIISIPVESPEVCPLIAQFESVRIWLGKDPVYPPAGAVSLEKATSMTMEEFSKLLIGDPNKACFILNGKEFLP